MVTQAGDESLCFQLEVTPSGKGPCVFPRVNIPLPFYHSAMAWALMISAQNNVPGVS